MKKSQCCFLFFLISFLMINFQFLYSQTYFDYYEKMRLERKEKKIKAVKTNNGVIDYFDEEGFHIKREYYLDGNLNSYSLINQQSNGEFIVKGNIGTMEEYTIRGSQALFYETYFDPYNLIDNVTMVFDSKSRLIEKRITGTDYEGNDIKKYIYKEDGTKPIKEEYFCNNELIHKTDYFYDDSGLLIKDENLWINTNERTITIYTYEFY